jgi:hypothetical protein
MARDFMIRCEQRKLYKTDGLYEQRWKDVAVTEILQAAPQDIRCVHCHGAVRLHRQQAAQGPQDHAEHRLRQDSEGCRGGHYFRGEHQMSSRPVT